MANFLDGSKGGFVIVDYAITALAIFGNCLVLESISHEQFGLTLIGYRHFLISLAISDLYMCGVNVAMFVHNAVDNAMVITQFSVTGAKCFSNMLRSFQLVGYFANLFNLCGISVEHYVGTMFPMRYRVLMSKMVARTAVVIVWTLAIISGILDVPVTAVAFYVKGFGNDIGHASGHETWFGNGSHVTDNNFTDNFPPANFTFTGNSSPSNLTNNNNNMTAYYGLARDEAPFLSSPNSTNSEEETEIGDNEIEILFNKLFPSDPAKSHSTPNEPEVVLKSVLQSMTKSGSANPTFCNYHSMQQFWVEISVMGLTLVCFAFLVVCYGIIFRKVFKTAMSLKKRTIKLIVTTALFLTSFTVCWVPMMVHELAMLWYIIFHSQQRPMTSSPSDNSTETDGTRTTVAEQLSPASILIQSAFNTLLISYPLIDPIIYAARIPAVKKRILNHFRSLLPCIQHCIKETSVMHKSSTVGGDREAKIALANQRSQAPTDAISLNGTFAYSPSLNTRMSNNNIISQASINQGGFFADSSGHEKLSRHFSAPNKDEEDDSFNSISNFNTGEQAGLLRLHPQPAPFSGVAAFDRNLLAVGRCLSLSAADNSQNHSARHHLTGQQRNNIVSVRRALPTLEYADGAEP